MGLLRPCSVRVREGVRDHPVIGFPDPQTKNCKAIVKGIAHDAVDGCQCDARGRSPVTRRIEHTCWEVLQAGLSG